MVSLPPAARAHEACGHYLDLGGRRVFVREEGDGPPILLLHGVPASSFLYRKMMATLAGSGFRAVAFDFPGLGLSDKPPGARYDWHALADSVEAVAEALGLNPVHLVVHDIGGPIGFEWAIHHPERMRSLTICNTMLDLPAFRRPFPMWLYVVPGLRRAVMATQNPLLLAPLMWRIGVKGPTSLPYGDVRAYLALLEHNGGARSFLDVMAGFDLSADHGRFLLEGLQALERPMQLVWGQHEIAIPVHQAEYIREHLPLERIHWVDGRHFIQEDAPHDVAAHIAGFARMVEDG